MTVATRTRQSDMGEIRTMLISRIDALARHLAPGGDGCRHGAYWMPLNPTRADRNPGSFWIMLSGPKAGAWADEATGDGAAQNRNGHHSGDVFGLIQYCLALPDFKAAIYWARDWLGLARMSDGQRSQILANVRLRQERAELHTGERETRILDDKRRQAKAAFFGANEAIRNTPVDAYLTGRGIDLGKLERLPSSLRFMPAAKHHETGTTWPAMIACMVGPDNELWAVHRTFLALDGATKAPVIPAKKMFPSYAGSAIRLWRGATGMSIGEAAKHGIRETLVIVEGIENGLSVAMAAPELRIWSVGAIGNIAAQTLPECVDEVLIVADNDWGNAQAQQILARGAEALIRQGRKVSITRAFGAAEDVNDLLQKGAA